MASVAPSSPRPRNGDGVREQVPDVRRIVSRSPFLQDLMAKRLLKQADDAGHTTIPKRSVEDMRQKSGPSCVVRLVVENPRSLPGEDRCGIAYHGDLSGLATSSILEGGFRAGEKPTAYGKGVYVTPSFRYCAVYYGFLEEVADGGLLLHVLEVKCRRYRMHPIFPPSWQPLVDAGVAQDAVEWVVERAEDVAATAVVTKELRGRTEEELKDPAVSVIRQAHLRRLGGKRWQPQRLPQATGQSSAARAVACIGPAAAAAALGLSAASQNALSDTCKAIVLIFIVPLLLAWCVLSTLSPEGRAAWPGLASDW
eukprot:TRINITY_DN22591_c0_g1_i1.p1 TRINITY_DN22591_c0_g1~~TRINITY_DN22591_c0_g1_i1.p1  ORF type:complete len:332 (-),score=36.98 TRINITY_DN22591_c0_g1_i1:468-1400(-)